ncbi:MAG: hypothetical protein RXR20_08975 [Paraburkholderia sp.]|jgi:hypothetical protein|uniref:hypothetical protein n=1 Tax=Paraburkholderia sp. TaxID=1926495 RepID=UPI00397E33A2
MTARLTRLWVSANNLLRLAWIEVLTIIVFMLVISLRFPSWFVVLSAIVNGGAAAYVARCIASERSTTVHDPLLFTVLIGSGMASITLTLKWWLVEKQFKLASGTLLHMTGHAEATSNPALAWSSVLTQWGSCSIFLVIVAIWALSRRHAT